MLWAVLRSDTALPFSIQIIRTLVRLRQLLATHADLARKLAELEGKYDRQFKVIFDALRDLIASPEPPAKPRIGFTAEERKGNSGPKKSRRSSRRHCRPQSDPSLHARPDSRSMPDRPSQSLT